MSVSINMINKFDDLKLYFKIDCPVNDKIILKQPSIGDILEQGEQKYYSMIQTIATIPSDVKYPLYQSEINYEEISNFDLFMMLAKGLSQEDTKLILGDIDLSSFDIIQLKDNDEIVMYNQEKDIVIDRYIYQIIFDYVCKLHKIVPKVEKAGNDYTRKILIEEDKEKRERQKNSKEEYKSIFMPMISFLSNSSGCKYNGNDILNLGIFQFMDSVKRVDLIEKTKLTLQGIYAGKIDSSKVDKSELNWMKEL